MHMVQKKTCLDKQVIGECWQAATGLQCSRFFMQKHCDSQRHQNAMAAMQALTVTEVFRETVECEGKPRSMFPSEAACMNSSLSLTCGQASKTWNPQPSTCIWGPLAISWFITPITYSYIYHKP